MLAGTAALAVAPAYALAQNGFPDYRQAAADQYPTQPPSGNTGSEGNGGGSQTGGSSGNERPVQHATKGSGHRLGATKHRGAGGNAPVAVPTKPVPAAKGSLPFTGSDLSGLVVLR